MPRIVLSLSEQQKTHWVEQAYSERVSLSEWIRRRCDARQLPQGAVPRDDLAKLSDAITVLPEEPSSRTLPAHNADPKDKAKQEHAPKEKRKGAMRSSSPAPGQGLCPHRVPIGSFCKRCDEEKGAR